MGDIRDENFIISVAKEFCVDGILAVATDVPVVAVAKACSILGLPGLNPNSAKISIDKLLQRQQFKKFNLTTPKFCSFNELDNLETKIAATGLPAVVKPVDSSGSRGVTLVQWVGELLTVLEKQNRLMYLLLMRSNKLDFLLGITCNEF